MPCDEFLSVDWTIGMMMMYEQQIILPISIVTSLFCRFLFNEVLVSYLNAKLTGMTLL